MSTENRDGWHLQDTAAERAELARRLLPLAPPPPVAWAKLTSEDAEAIRLLYDSGGYTQAEIAYSYGVTRSTISKVVNDKTWKGAAHEDGKF